MTPLSKLTASRDDAHRRQRMAEARARGLGPVPDMSPEFVEYTDPTGDGLSPEELLRYIWDRAGIWIDMWLSKQGIE